MLVTCPVTNREEVARRLRARVAEIAMRHGRQMSPEFREEAEKALREILSDYPELAGSEPTWSIDPFVDVGDEATVMEVHLGGLPPPTLVPSLDDPAYDDDPDGV